MDSSSVLTNLIELTNNVTDAFTTALYVVDPVNNTLHLKEHLTLSDNLDKEAIIPIGEGPVGLAASDQLPSLNEFSKDNQPDLPMYKTMEDLKGLMAVPVMNGNLEGVLVVDTKEKHHFSAKVQKIVSNLADQMAWHLNQEKTARGLDDKSFLPYHEIVRLCRLLGESPNRQALTDQLMQIPKSLINHDAIAVIWFSKEGENGKVTRHHGWDHELRDMRIYSGKGIVGSCIKNKVPFLIRNANGRPAVIFSENENQESVQSILSVPILLNDTVRGAIVCGAKRPYTFCKSSLDKLNLLVSFASSSLMCQDVREQWDYDKNLCQVTHIPNHRFLTTYRQTIEQDVFRSGKPAFALTTILSNLSDLYESLGIEMGDLIIKKAIDVLAKTITTPKYFFRYSDNSLLILLMNITSDDARRMEKRFQRIFINQPMVIEGHSIELKLDCGLAIYPADSKNLGELAGISLARAARNSKGTS
jgi:GGDEF domain-containing protein